MAINISQFPTSFNMANNNLVYTVTSSQATQPQFQYVCDVYLSGSTATPTTLVQRIKQQPNPSSYGVFDLGQIMANYLDMDDIWTVPTLTKGSGSAKWFLVKFGEEYGTSTSSSVILYSGIAAATGSPAVSASSYLQVFNGLVEPNDKVNWNFPSQSYFTPNTTPTGGFFAYQNALTDAPYTQSIRLTDYGTIGIYNGCLTPNTASAQDIYAIYYRFYDATGSLLDEIDYINNITQIPAAGPRNVAANLWSIIGGPSGTYFREGLYSLIYGGSGPANIEDAGFTIPADTAYYKVDFVTDAGGAPNYTGSYASYQFNIVDPNCGYDGVRFAWKNVYGTWDYYTFTLQSDSAFVIERNSYEQSFVNFSNTTTTVPYNRSRRGSSQFYNDLDQTKTANSDWLSQQEADWLRELFFSTDVYQQSGSAFIPVVISSANLVEKKNPRTQKTFQYLIEFKPANQLNPRI